MPAFVCVIEADNGEVKVGWSGAPYARLSQVKREYGPRRGFSCARLVGWVSTPYFLEVELLALGELDAFSVGGEWLRVDPELAMQKVAEIAGLLCGEEAEITRPSATVRKPPDYRTSA